MLRGRRTCQTDFHFNTEADLTADQITTVGVSDRERIATRVISQHRERFEVYTAPDSRAASDTVDVQHVIDAYHEAVLTHDGSRLAHLFIPQGSMWLNVLSDEAYARAKAKSPDAVKIRVGSYTDLQSWFRPQRQASIQHTHICRRTATVRLRRCTLTSYS
jgi:hypothetical protein